MEVYTLDINFDNLDNLNLSVEEVRKILDVFKYNEKIFGYYLMRYYNENYCYLGIKIVFNNSKEKEETLKGFKEKIKLIKGYKNVRQDNPEGEIKNNLSLICSISTEFRNKIWDLLKRKPTDEEFFYMAHYLANPLLLGGNDEKRISQNYLFRGEAKN